MAFVRSGARTPQKLLFTERKGARLQVDGLDRGDDAPPRERALPRCVDFPEPQHRMHAAPLRSGA